MTIIRESPKVKKRASYMYTVFTILHLAYNIIANAGATL